MIYHVPSLKDPVDQGDIIDGCPILQVTDFDPQSPAAPKVACALQRVVVVTQTCDLANQKTRWIVVAMVHGAQFLVDQKIVSAADVRGPIRAGRVFGWYFLPRCPVSGLEESIVDLRQLHTIPRTVIEELCESGGRRRRIRPLYREHLVLVL